MIYIAHVDPSSSFDGNALHHLTDHEEDSHSPTPAGLNEPFHENSALSTKNRSLIFGPIINRKTDSGVISCKQALSVSNFVERPWFGRALVNLRTYPQWAVRTSVTHKKLLASYHKNN